MKSDQLHQLIASCTGTEALYRHWLSKHLVYTSGIKMMADAVGAYWLIDAICSHLPAVLKSADRAMLKRIQFWKLEVKDRKATLTCRADSDMKPVITQHIEFTDFPEGDWTFYVAANEDGGFTLLLPTEY